MSLSDSSENVSGPPTPIHESSSVKTAIGESGDTSVEYLKEVMSSAKSQTEASILGLKRTIVRVYKDVQYFSNKGFEATQNEMQKTQGRLFAPKDGDFEDIGDLLFELYVWNAWTLLVTAGFQFLGHFHIGELLLSPFVTKFMASLLSVVLIPLLFFCQLKSNTWETSMQNGKLELLILCAPIGLLSGYAMGTYGMPMYSPPAFFMPLFMGAIANTLANSATNRIVHAILIVGAGAGFCLGWGLMKNEVDVTFLFVLSIASFFYTLDLQVKVGAAELEEELEPVKSLLVSVVFSVTLDFLIAFLKSS